MRASATPFRPAPRRRRGLARVLACALAALPAAVLAQSSSGACDNCGTVQSIVRSVEKQAWQPLGSATPGTLVPGEGSTGTTSAMSFSNKGKDRGLVLLGSAGGAAYVKRPNAYDKPRWDVTVKLDRGGASTTSLAYEPFVREGDRVRMNGKQFELLNP